MRKSAMSIDEARRSIDALVGQKLKISVNKGRKKIVKYDGQIENIYSSVFTLKVNNKNTPTMSFSYSDVICGDIKLKSDMQ